MNIKIKRSLSDWLFSQDALEDIATLKNVENLYVYSK